MLGTRQAALFFAELTAYYMDSERIVNGHLSKKTYLIFTFLLIDATPTSYIDNIVMFPYSYRYDP